MAPMIWGTENTEKMLVYVLATNPQVKLDFDDMAKFLTTKDHQCTARALVERFKKIKRDLSKDSKLRVKVEQATYGHSMVKTAGKKRKVGKAEAAPAKALDSDEELSDAEEQAS